MRSVRPVIAALVVSAGTAVGVVAVAPSAGAHGYVSSPPSRQALCANGTVPDCGDLVYEPQSVEAPKGSTQCSGGSRFTVLDEGRDWPATSVGTSVTFQWRLTAAHSTGTWEYFVGGARVGSFDDGGAVPSTSVSHTVDLSGHPGRVTVLARWNIADTGMAFYSCVDLNVGGSGGGTAGGGYAPQRPAPSSATTMAPAAPPPPQAGAVEQPPAGHDHGSVPGTGTTTTSTAPPPPPPPAQGGYDDGEHDHGDGTGSGTWSPWTPYGVGDRVEWNGVTYTCRQAHTSQPDWEPSVHTLALWLPAAEAP